MSLNNVDSERIKEQLKKRKEKNSGKGNSDGKSSKKNQKEINSPKKDSKVISKNKNNGQLTNEGKVILRNLIAYSNYKKMISLTFLNFIILLIAVFTTYKFYIKPVPPRYIPMSENGNIIPYIPLNEPNMSDGEMMDYALHAVRDINMYDYINWKTQLTKTQSYFTQFGWNSYLSEFEKSNTINTVRKEKMIINMQPIAPPVIIRKGQVNVENAPPVYVWIVEIPINVNYISNIDSISKTNSIGGVVRLTIMRTKTVDNPTGVGIQIYQFDTSRTKVAN